MKAIVWYYAILFNWFQQRESCGVHTGVSWLSVLQIQWWLTVLFRIQTHNMHNVLLLFIIVPEMLGAGVNWNLGLTIGTGNRYQIPTGYQDSDYSNFASLAKVGDEVASNFASLMAIKKRLEENESSDHIMRIFGMVSMISVIIGGLLFKIRSVKQILSNQPQRDNIMPIPLRPQHQHQVVGFWSNCIVS